MKEKIEQFLTHAIHHLWTQENIQGELEHFTVEHPREKSHGDFSSNIAMVNAKSFKCAPRKLAEQIMALLPDDEAIAAVEIAGPGFINFKLSVSHLVQQLDAMWSSNTCAVIQVADDHTVVVDYSSPNLAKEMHVGHLRSTVIGDAIARILEYKGYHVIRQNHVGDWGTQFGMLLANFVDQEQEHPGQVELADLESFYKTAKLKFDEDEEFAERARQWVVLLQAGDRQALHWWQMFIRLSLDHCQAVYQRLGVTLQETDLRPESFYNDDLPVIVRILSEQGLLVTHQGAQCVFLPQFQGKNQEPLPVIVQKNDGGFLYASTDLAALRYRAQSLHAQRILYVVDARQSLHFQQIFAVAYLAGLVPAEVMLEHVSFGMVLDKSGRPFKSREGGVTKLADLLDEAERRAMVLIRSKSSQVEDLEHMARVIAIASVKYADLSKHRTSDYVFDWDTMISFEGNTAPYLMYAYTRILSVFVKAGIVMQELQGAFCLTAQAELDLAKHLSLFPELIETVVQKLTPHVLCTYLYDLAGLFSVFYEHCPILGDLSRLKLAALTAKVLKQGLSLLGIETLNRM